jgi:hypothetical protein
MAITLDDHIACIFPLSKNLRGELDLVESEEESCDKHDCRSLETAHRLKAEVGGHDCDFERGRLTDGILVASIVSKFADADGTRRGVHEGAFRLRGASLITGELRGVTNAGTHREPVFDACQKCEEPGVMEGLLLGTIRRSPDKALIGCRVQAAYRLRYEADQKGGSGEFQGTLEGGIICICRD